MRCLGSDVESTVSREGLRIHILTWHIALLRLLPILLPQAKLDVGLQGFQISQSQWEFIGSSRSFLIFLRCSWSPFTYQTRANKIIREDIYRSFVQVPWVNPPRGLRPMMAFYAKHFLELRDGVIVRLQYTFHHQMYALRIPLGQFRIGSHRLRVETNHQVDRLDKLCQVCHLQEVETEVHFILG